MIRNAVADFLAILRSVFKVSPPLPEEGVAAPVRAEQPSVSWTGLPRGRDLLPPDLSTVAERSPAIAPAVLAAYWREALTYLDFSSLTRGGEREIKPLHIDSLDATARRAGMAADDTEPAARADGAKEVNVVIGLWEVDRKGALQARRQWHPLLNVPAQMDGEGQLTPRVNAMPELNASYLGPDVQPRCFALGAKDRADEMLLSAIAALAGDGTSSPGWTAWWQAWRQVLNGLTGYEDDAMLAEALGKLANEVKANSRKSSWALFAAIYPGSGSGTKAVADVYANLLDAGVDEAAGLFRRLCASGGGDDLANLPQASHRLVLGHIDEHEAGSRTLFPLDPTQRNAVRSILSLEPGQLQAVNGPPGSGKTAMLRAVVASKWVAAALLDQPCPVIVACGATNQSVTNVIEAFGKAPHPDASVPHAQRWIDGAPSYGAFLPSGKYKGDEKNLAEIGRIVCIERIDSPANASFLYRYFQRTNILDPAWARSCENAYLARARAALGEASLHKVEDAVQAVWRRLREVVEQGEACLAAASAGDAWVGLGEQYLALHGRHWSAQRKEVAETLLSARGDAAARLSAALQFVDLGWRSEAFHWAARFWEGKFLLAQRERLLSRHPCNVEEALRRLCMLTPCLVSTLHTLPQFAQIDPMAADPDETRSHVYGVIDLLVLDEAGQALPELAGAAFALAKTAAVVGDLKQLAPVASNTRLSEIGIAARADALEVLDAIERTGRSVVSGSALAMARHVAAWREGDDDGVTLRFHYRCKPSIIGYCNTLCYNKTLQPRTRENSTFPEPALAWVNVDAEPALLGGSQCNRAEADAIVEWIAERWPAWQAHPATQGKALQDIVAIVTPYRAQADYLSGRLQAVFNESRRQGGNWPDSDAVRKVTIGTVHRLQGAERPIVCFSLVEGSAQAAGSFIDRDATLMNVAVSRAKSSFIIFANPERLFPPAADKEAMASVKPVHRLGLYLKDTPGAGLLYPKKLVLIEAGGKLGTMSAILGKASAITATGGALWNLPLENGVDLAAGLVPRPAMNERAPAALAQARKILESVDELVIATDDDRMGEYIAWQALQLLGTDAAGKLVGRVRLGAITPAEVARAFAAPAFVDEHKVLAEAVREVVDWLVTRRFARLVDCAPSSSDAERKVLRELGVCTDDRRGTVQMVGRVQGAVLRMLLQRGRQVAAAADQYRINARVEVGGRQYTGQAFILGDGRELTPKASAERFVSKAVDQPLVVLNAPTIHTEACAAPLPGTIEILTRAWERFRIRPWDAMALMQALYDGSWSDARASKTDIEEPIAGAATAAGHPPLRPLDRSATPEQMRSVMSTSLHQVYSLIWDYYLASEQPAVSVTSTCLRYQVTERFGVKFESLRCEGLDEELSYLMFDRHARRTRAANAGLARHRMQLTGKVPVYTAEPALPWDVRPDQLLQEMADARIGRPSTYASALRNLEARKLLRFPDDDGPLRLTPDGLATALALEQEEAVLSSPVFSAQLFDRIGRIETGQCGPREVLLDLGPQLAPQENWATLGAHIWDNLEELEEKMRQRPPGLPGGPLVSRGDAGECHADGEWQWPCR